MKVFLNLKASIQNNEEKYILRLSCQYYILCNHSLIEEKGGTEHAGFVLVTHHSEVAIGKLPLANSRNDQQNMHISLNNVIHCTRHCARHVLANHDRARLYRTAMGIHTVTDQKSNISCSVLGNIFLLHSLSTWARLSLCSTYAAFWQLITIA